MRTPSYSDQAWAAPTTSGPLQAEISVPGSKSITNRELVLAALADGPSQLHGALHSRDTDLMAAALQALGAHIETTGDTTRVTPATPTSAHVPAVTIDCGLAGTVMRFTPPVAALLGRAARFDGDEAARRRPMAPLVQALEALGANIHTSDGALPLEIRPGAPLHGGRATVHAAASSQFVSALLLIGARLPGGLHLEDVGATPPSLPHITMTLECLNRRGVPARALDARTWEVPSATIQARDTVIEPDLSNAAPFLAAAAIVGGHVRVSRWPEHTTQVGVRFPDLLQQAGAQVLHEQNTLAVRGTGQLHGLDLDLSEAGELVPTLCAVLALADTPSRIRGIAHLRGHETNRLRAIVEDLRALGGTAEEFEDGVGITPAPLHGGVWKAFGDHRMATAGALIGLRVPGVTVDHIETTAKTMPEFPQLWARMLSA